MKKLRGICILAIVLCLAVLIYQTTVEVGMSSAKAAHDANISKPQRSPSKAVLKVSSKKSDPLVQKDLLLTSEQKDFLCELKSLGTHVPIDGDVQIYTEQSTSLYGNEGGNVAWIKSQACPEGTYSIVQFSDDGRITRELDCRKATLKEIAAFSGNQGNILKAPLVDGQKNLAILGAGYFVLGCPNGRLVLTRDGHLRQNTEGLLSDKDNCVVLNQQGTAFHGYGLDQSGCNSSGDFVATVDPSSDEVSGLDYVNNCSFQQMIFPNWRSP